jgi:hypothetical protein
MHLVPNHWPTVFATFSFSDCHLFFCLPCRGELPPDENLEALNPATLLSKGPFLSLVLMVAILDPPRPEAIEAVKVAHRAGISVKMITGALRMITTKPIISACYMLYASAQ